MLARTSAFACALWLLVALLSICRGAEPKPGLPDDPDFRVQGEYQGEVATPEATKKFAIQVVALGKGKFRALAYWNGLPGDSWDKSDTLDLTGETAKGITTLTCGDYLVTCGKDLLRVATGGKEIGRLKKVERRSPTLGAKPPQGAVVLFDSKTADAFEGGRATDDGLLIPGTSSKASFQSGTLHVEFQVPYGPELPSRGNSGVYLQGRYEVQILDSFGFAPHNHECGGIPSIKAADVSMSFPPLAWQTYDVEFTAAKYRDGKKEKNARMTVKHNGVVIHDDVEVPHITTSAPLEEGPEPGPLNLQEHGAEVRYRNIWFLPREQ